MKIGARSELQFDGFRPARLSQQTFSINGVRQHVSQRQAALACDEILVDRRRKKNIKQKKTSSWACSPVV